MDIYQEFSRVSARGRPQPEPIEYTLKRIARLAPHVKKPCGLDEWLREVGANKADLARLLGVSRQLVSRFMNKRCPPSKVVMDKIYEITGGKIATLYDITK